MAVLVGAGCEANIGEVGPALPPPAVPAPASPREVPAQRQAGAVLPQMSPALEPFSIVVLPDTQFYSASYPEVFEAQTRWIVANRAAEQIAFVLHEGDIVDADEKGQWERAARALRRLDGVVPYALAAGNHDLHWGERGLSRNGNLMNDYFPAAEFLRYPWFRETFEPNDMENSFLLIDVGGSPWLVLALEFGPRDRVLAWADAILRRYPTTPAILLTHAYLYSDGTRYDHNKPEHLWDPKEDVNLEEGANDGEEMWDKLVSKHDNLRFVLSGHDPIGVARLTSERPSGSKVHQILANYQTCAYQCGIETGTMGGNGWLRIMRFEPAARRVVVRTYSPYLKQWKTDPANDFVLSL